MQIEVVGLGHPGMRAQNDDHFCIGALVEQDAPVCLSFETRAEFFREYGLLCCVADGMGGYAGGGQASHWALEALAGQFHSGTHGELDAKALELELARCLRRTHELLSAKLRADPGLSEAGTTLAGIVLLPPGRLCVFHAGDSRVLLAAGGYARQLTADHTPVGQRVFAGLLSEEDALEHPEARRLTRALGLIGDTEVELQCGLEWAPGDAFIICTDGLHALGNGLSRQRLQEVMRQPLPLKERARQMVGEAALLAQADNSTLVLVEVSPADPPLPESADG